MNKSSLGQNTQPKSKRKTLDAEGNKVKQSVQKTPLDNFLRKKTLKVPYLGQYIQYNKDNVVKLSD